MTLVSIPANPVPEGAITGELRTPDGVTLRYARWDPPPGRKGTVCLFQGRAEFIEKYFETVHDLRARGFAVATIDWRGQGLSQRALSDPRKGHVRDFAEFDLDLETFMKEIVLPDCPPPHFAIGHSMGGTMLVRAAHGGRRWFDRIVLSAPMLAVEGPVASRGVRLGMRLARLAGFGTSYVPGGGATYIGSLPFLGNRLTSDPVRYARTGTIVETEPRVAVGFPTIAWADAAFRAMSVFADPTYPNELRQPMLIVAAGRDEVISTESLEQFAVQLRVGSHLVISGAKHELMMEQDQYRGQFLAAFDAFVPGSARF